MINFFGNLASSSSPVDKAPTGTKVIIVFGQSNAAGEQSSMGTAPFEELPEYLQGDLLGVNRIFKYGQRIVHDDFTVVNDTLSDNIGSDLSLGYKYQRYHNEEIYIIKYAHGATALSQQANPNWNVATSGEDSLFEGFIDCVHTAMQKLINDGKTPTIRGIVWYQGEEDGFQNQSRDEYRVNEQNLFNSLNTEFVNYYLGEALNIYSVKISTDKGPSSQFERIREAKDDNSLALPKYITLDASNYSWTTHAYHGLHLSKQGQIDLGNDIFELIKHN